MPPSRRRVRDPRAHRRRGDPDEVGPSTLPLGDPRRHDEAVPSSVPLLPDKADPGDELGLVSPAKTLRLLHALQGTLEELHMAPLDEAGCRRLAAAQRALLIEAASTVSPGLFEEMVRLHMAPVGSGASAAQLEVAYAQLLGWLTGLFSAGGLITGTPVKADTYTFTVLPPEDETG